MSELKVSLTLDTAGENLLLKHEQDVSAILDDNKRAQADSIGQRFGDFAHVARIPDVVVMEWKEKYGINAMAPSPEDKIRMVALLNDPDYAYLRRRGGRL
jgi:hypothetical protein